MAGRPAVNVFVSYRRQDTSHLAGRLYDRLVDRFDHSHVFMDVDSIEPGSDFHEAIDRAVSASDIVLALIGPTWLTGVDDRGRRRLDDPDDLVRSEIRAALRGHVRLIPVLVDGARMPDEDELPAELRPLRRRHAVQLDHPTFRSDVETLIAAIARAPSSAREPRVPPPTAARSSRPTGSTTPPTAPLEQVPGVAPRSLVTADHPHRRRRSRAIVLTVGLIAFVAAVVLIAGSLRAGPVTVPNLNGKTVDEAREAVDGARLGLAAPATGPVADPGLIDKVIAQDPEPGRQVPVRDTVRITVGGASATTAPPTSTGVVPDVTGKTADDARRQLVQAGFVVRQQDVDAGGAQGDVVATDPAAGTQVPPGSTVTLEVSTGDSSELTMPAVIGNTVGDAERKLAQAGFRDLTITRRATSDASAEGRVLDQSPGAGSRVPPGDRVTLIVGQLTGSNSN